MNTARKVTSALDRCWRRIVRFKYVFLTYKDYADMLNRVADAQNTLMRVYSGKQDNLSREECRKLANKLGVPSWAQKR